MSAGGGSPFGDPFPYTPTPTGENPGSWDFSPVPGPDPAQAFMEGVIRPALGGGVPPGQYPPSGAGWDSRSPTGSTQRAGSASQQGLGARAAPEPEPEQPRVVRGGPGWDSRSDRGSEAGGSHREPPGSVASEEHARQGMWTYGTPPIRLNFGTLSAKAESYKQWRMSASQ